MVLVIVPVTGEVLALALVAHVGGSKPAPVNRHTVPELPRLSPG
jgi:hypothetical protein